MVGTICSVALCKNNAIKIKQTGEKIGFFSFPKDNNFRKKWVKRCYRKDEFNPVNKRICGKHFLPSDFKDAIEAKITNRAPRRLKYDAVPSLFLLPDDYEDRPKEESANDLLTDNEEESKPKKRKRKEFAHSFLTISTQSEYETKFAVCPENTAVSGNLDDLNHLAAEKCKLLELEIKSLKEKCYTSENRVKELECKTGELTATIQLLKKNFDEKVKEVFAEVLSSNQIDLILGKKSTVKWSIEEITKALSLRFLNKSAYLHLRSELKYPLPGITSLQRWASRINFRNGILLDVIHCMGIAGKLKSELERVTVLSLGKMKVSTVYEYDTKEDEVVGPYNDMMVIMAAGLCSQWKQPVFIDFDKKVTAEIFFKIVSLLKNMKYSVVACVSVSEEDSQNLWEELCITVEKTYVLHPMTTEKIYFFVDAPDLLKSLRYWFLHTGFVLSDSSLITKDPVVDLVNSVDIEINSYHILTGLHLICEEAQRKILKFAAELFSTTTGTAIQKYLPGTDKKLAKDVGDFLVLVSNWFDIMDCGFPGLSCAPTNKVVKKTQFGLDIVNQIELLNKFSSVVSEMKCQGENTLQPFQKGIIISCKSLQNLHCYLKQMYDVRSISTKRLSMENLERFFSQVKSKVVSDDQPSPLNAIHRIQQILLGKVKLVVTNNKNANDVCEESYLFTEFIKRIEIKEHKLNLTRPILLQDKVNESTFACVELTCSASANDKKVLIEVENLPYVAGFMAKKYLKAFPYVAAYGIAPRGVSEHSYSMLSSPSDIVEPSEIWMDHVRRMNKYFRVYNGKKLKSSKKILFRLIRNIQKKMPDIPVALVREFNRQRLYNRIKYLNSIL